MAFDSFKAEYEQNREIARERHAKEREQRKNLHGKALVQYIWLYYKFHFLFSIIGIVVVVSLLSAILTPSKLDRPNCLVSINGGGDYAAWFAGFGDWLGIDPDTEQVTATTSFIYSTSSIDYSAQTAIMVHLSAGEYDCIIGDDEMLDYSMQMDASYDLDELFPDDLKALIGDRFVACAFVTSSGDDTETVYGEEHNYAVDITDTKFVSECGITAERVTFTIPSTAANTDDAIILLRYILSE